MVGWDDAAADPLDLFHALAVQAPEAAGLLRRRERSQRTRPHVVLRSGVPQLQRVRLRRRHASQRAERRAGTSAMATRARSATPRVELGQLNIARRSSCGGTARGCSPSTSASCFENKEEVRWHWDGRDRWKMFEVEKPVRAAFAQVDPDHVLLLDVNYTNNSMTLAPQAGARGAQMVARLAGLAAGSSADLRVLRLMSATRRIPRRRSPGQRRADGAGRHVRRHAARRRCRWRTRCSGMIAAHLGLEPGGGNRGGGHELRLVAGVLRAGDRPRHDVRPVDHRVRRRCSTT